MIRERSPRRNDPGSMKELTVSHGNLRSRFTHNVATSVVTETELREHLCAVDTPVLLVCAVAVAGDLSLLDQFADKGGSPGANIRGRVEAREDLATTQAHAELTDI